MRGKSKFKKFWFFNRSQFVYLFKKLTNLKMARYVWSRLKILEFSSPALLIANPFYTMLPAGASVHACVYTSTSKDARASNGKKLLATIKIVDI